MIGIPLALQENFFASEELSSLIKILCAVYCEGCSVIAVIRTLNQPPDHLTVNTWEEGSCLLEPMVLTVAKFRPIISHRQAAEALIK